MSRIQKIRVCKGGDMGDKPRMKNDREAELLFPFEAVDCIEISKENTLEKQNQEFMRIFFRSGVQQLVTDQATVAALKKDYLVWLHGR